MGTHMADMSGLVPFLDGCICRQIEGEGESADDAQWEVTGVVSGVSYNNWRTEIMWLLEPVPLPPVRALCLTALRTPLRQAVRESVDRCIDMLVEVP
ncbi:hypothetical protein KIPB_015838 [Kipferlia bialata]|uniref:Uncharacterized protein n=1 Tax=Kipferlia bialata TaxID=797122 RepID=A0A9K3DDW6_9EUKA|nr:hypothetical protein KIPB_015838 [Kipferlia bialata]|eukprot:g15838.t1